VVPTATVAFVGLVGVIVSSRFEMFTHRRRLPVDRASPRAKAYPAM
jgi:hypothetical protein